MTALDIYVESIGRFRRTPEYKLNHMLKGLARAGLQWRLIDGPSTLPRDPAPAAFFHVDLSDLPPFFADKAGRHERAINGRALSIRKSGYVTGLLSRDDPYEGPVIVKTDLNFRGIPEKRYAWRQSLGGKLRHVLRWARDRHYIANSCPPYAIYPSRAEAPPTVWDDDALIVEKFHPESTDPPIVKHRVEFFHDVELPTRSTFSAMDCDPNSLVDIEFPTETPPDIGAVRDRLSLDYGAIDYFVTKDGVEIIDANKTVGLTPDWIDSNPAVAAHGDAVTNELIDFVRGETTWRSTNHRR